MTPPKPPSALLGPAPLPPRPPIATTWRFVTPSGTAKNCWAPVDVNRFTVAAPASATPAIKTRHSAATAAMATDVDDLKRSPGAQYTGFS